MAISINLLKDKHALTEKQYQLEKLYLRYSVVALVIMVVLTLALSSWALFLSLKLKGVEDKITNSTKELANLTEANAEQLYLKSRLVLITSFLDNRSVQREALQKIFSQTIPGVVVSAVGFEGDNKLAVQMTADNANSLGEVLLVYGKSTDFFVQTVGRGITKGQDGSYQLQLSLTIPKEGK